ncbi:rRNA processing protein Rrp5 [Ceraceosorus bombacis]|uniref:rRNA processing protein Rrp5 n=1 Tax=Ceraceosorus bombacis TaxID=401625 RepID=A0A0P1BD53_9BASI|nr:rRNA processing protein Rrp5 [Ceraceosorus bombacis]
MSLKRPHDSAESSKKKSRSSANGPASKVRGQTSHQRPAVTPAPARAPEADFPRGGGSGLTPLEHAQALREGRAERAAAADLFTENSKKKKSSSSSSASSAVNANGSTRGKKQGESDEAAKARRRKEWREMRNAKKKKSLVLDHTRPGAAADADEEDRTRVEHLNYKRLSPGSRMLCTVLAVHPLALIVSLPNQLLGHIPLTNISSILNERLKAAAEESDDEESDEEKDSEDEDAPPQHLRSDSEDTSEDGSAEGATSASKGLPELRDLYKVGDWLRVYVVAIKSAGAKSLGREGQEYQRDAGRVELSLDPALLNDGITPQEVLPSALLSIALKTKEDHGWTLDSGIANLSGFAAISDVPASAQVGQVFTASVKEFQKGSRVFTATCHLNEVGKAMLGAETAPSLSMLGPGMLVSALITHVDDDGLSAKLWGLFNASIDAAHLPLPPNKTMEQAYKIGSKIKARVLWDLGPNAVGQDPADDQDSAEKQGGRKLALSRAPHVLELKAPPGLEGYPMGTKFSVKVAHVDKEWGLSCEIVDGGKNAPKTFVHISRVSDDHVVGLSASSGRWKEGSLHEARVIGHAPTDGRLLLSLQASVLKHTFMRVSELAVGSVHKATVASIGPGGNAIFLDLGGTTHGVVFPLHFADVPLRKPEKKYKAGAVVKTRIIGVDPTRNRISCTLKKSLVSSDLPMIAALQDARVGVVTVGTVSRFLEPRASTSSAAGNPTALLVDLLGGLRALVPGAEANDGTSLNSSGTSLRSTYFEGKVVRLRLTQVDYSTGRITASIRQASPSYLARLDVDAVSLGDKVQARTAAVHTDVVVLELLPSRTRALLSLQALAQERSKDVEQVRSELQEGEIISDLVVVDKNKDKGLVILGNSSARPKSSSSGVREGSIVSGMVVARGREPNVASILLPSDVMGSLHATDCHDEFQEDPLPEHKTKVEVVVLGLRGKDKKRAIVSMRPSELAKARVSGAADASSARDLASESLASIKEGDQRKAYVKAIANSGLFVELARNVTARVLISELFDEYVHEWKSSFKVGQLVSGTVTSIDPETHRMEFSLKSEPGSSAKSRKDAAARKEAQSVEKLSLQDLEVGQKVDGFIRAVAEFGVFVQIEGTRISGLAHKTELSDNKAADALKAFSVGDKVRAVVLKIDLPKSRISFGLKPSYFDEADYEEEEEQQEEESEEEGDFEDGSSDVEMDGEAFLAKLQAEDDSDDDERLELHADEEDDEEMVGSGDASDSDKSDDEEDDSSEEEELSSEAVSGQTVVDDDEEESFSASDVDPAAKSMQAKHIVPALELAGGFSWSVPQDGAQLPGQPISGSEDSDQDSEDDEGESAEDDAAANGTKEKGQPKKKKKSKKAAAGQEDLTADLATKQPESTADFERMLLGSPHSSYLWIQFMSFQLQLSDVEKAREVARRGLKVISFREEQERLNVWIALLNLENAYGTSETLDTVFKQAAQACDAKTIHLRLAAILEHSEKHEQAEELWRRTAKKFGFSSKVWVGWVQFYLRRGRVDDARGLIPRSMQALEKRKHVKTIQAIAMSCYKLGEPEQARTIFEGLVDSYPKRLDLWLVYIDQEAKLEETSTVRSLFERVLALRQSSKKAKSVLKKWLAWEQSIGSAKGEQAVLKRAREWAQQLQSKRQVEGEADADQMNVDDGADSDAESMGQ